MKQTLAAWLVLALWTAGLLALAVFGQRHLAVSADLRLFLPSPTTPEQRLLLEEIGEGPASRALVIALQGGAPERLADVSREMVESSATSTSFRWITNGDVAFDAFPENLLAYRFLLSPTFDAQALDRDYLSAEIAARTRDLSSPAGLVLEPLIARDPTLELLALLQRWQPTQEPRREFDVWFDQAGERALLIGETRAAAFDPDAQRAALGELERAFESADRDDGMTMTVSGTGGFSVLMEARTRGEAQSIGRAATIGMLLLLLVAYRRIGSVLLSALPLVTAGLAGLAVVSTAFGSVHGITLAFGFTLIGVAQDYPLHLLSHRRADLTASKIARRLWPTLATGLASTCIAYLTFLFSGVLGLEQLACFTVTALAVAGLTTRFLLPLLMSTRGPDYGASEPLGRLWRALVALPRPSWAGLALLTIAVIAIATARQPFWENDLAKLTPVPADLLAQDRELRTQLGTADLRYLLVVGAATEEAALAHLESIDGGLRSLVDQGAIGGYDHAALYVPAPATQRARQAKLPDADSVRAAVAAAQSGTSFRLGVFEPFIEDVARARALPPLTVDVLRGTALGARIEMLLIGAEGGTTALVTFNGVADPAALRAFGASHAGVTFLDLKESSEALVAKQRARILWSLAVASLLLIAVVSFSLRRPERVYRVLLPMALTTVVVVGALQALGISMNLFHLISLVLVAGLGLDYALFFEHAADDPAEQRRTLHAVLVCSLSTSLVFVLLAASSLPVLRAIGLPVAIGVVTNFVLALLMTRPPASSDARAR